MKTADLMAWWFIMVVVLSPLGFEPPASAAEAQSTYWAYFGTYTGQRSQGIYVSEFNPTTGTLTPVKLAAETKNPTFLALSPDRQFLYAVNEVGDFEGKNSGAVSSFRVDQKTGALSFLNQKPSGGAGPCHVSVAQDGKCIVVANYGSGSTAVLPIDSDGRLREPSASVQHHGASANRQRQEGPHAHFVTWDPERTHVLVCDLGLDKVLSYRLDPAGYQLSPAEPAFFSVQAGSGPRHLAFSPNGHFAYVLNELSSTLTCCSYDWKTGEMKEIQSLSTLPEHFKGANTCAEIEIDASGRFLYASNRGHDSIAVFALDATNGKASLKQHQGTQGKTPRHFCLDPTGKWLLAENQDSDSVAILAVDAQTGKLANAAESQKIGAPVCAVFVPKH